MSMELDRVFELLPAFLRQRDFLEGQQVKGTLSANDDRRAETFGPLRTLASLIVREGQIVEEQLDALYDDAFIETCEDWVVPYLAELIGVRGMSAVVDGVDLRARLADALLLRGRKGTLRALEHATSTSSNWPIFAVEYARKLVHSQSMRLVDTSRGRSISVRDREELERLDTPFERTARNVEVRKIDTKGGRWNFGNVGIHAWRLRSITLTNHQLRPLSAARSNEFRIHPLRCDAPLYNRSYTKTGIDSPLNEFEYPSAIKRSIMAKNVGRYYGAGDAVVSGEPPRAMHLSLDGVPIALDTIRVAHLGDLSTGDPTEPDWNFGQGKSGFTLIDPELGRVVLDSELSGELTVSCHYAQALEIGGGEHERSTSIGSAEDGLSIAPTDDIVDRINNAGGEGVFWFETSNTYAGNGVIDVPDNALLRLVATDGHFPTLDITGGLNFNVGANATIELNGLRMHGAGVRFMGFAEHVSVVDSTLLPGWTVDRLGNPETAGAVSIEIESRGTSLEIIRCITGAIRLNTDVDLRAAESTVDAVGFDNIAVGPTAATVTRHVARFDRCTVLGRVVVDAFGAGSAELVSGSVSSEQSDERLATSDTLFHAEGVTPIQATHRQTGCLRFSRIPQDSETPRLHRCSKGAAPRFRSVRYIDTAYVLLHKQNTAELLRGAENGGEIGVWNSAAMQARVDNVQRAIQDFLRFGHAAGIFNET